MPFNEGNAPTQCDVVMDHFSFHALPHSPLNFASLLLSLNFASIQWMCFQVLYAILYQHILSSLLFETVPGNLEGVVWHGSSFVEADHLKPEVGGLFSESAVTFCWRTGNTLTFCSTTVDEQNTG